MLIVKNATKKFGGLTAVNDASLTIENFIAGAFLKHRKIFINNDKAFDITS